MIWCKIAETTIFCQILVRFRSDYKIFTRSSTIWRQIFWPGKWNRWSINTILIDLQIINRIKSHLMRLLADSERVVVAINSLLTTDRDFLLPLLIHMLQVLWGTIHHLLKLYTEIRELPDESDLARPKYVIVAKLYWIVSCLLRTYNIDIISRFYPYIGHVHGQREK
jgi:hypothetical protein